MMIDDTVLDMRLPEKWRPGAEKVFIVMTLPYIFNTIISIHNILPFRYFIQQMQCNAKIYHRSQTQLRMQTPKPDAIST